MYHVVHWDMTEIVGDVYKLFPALPALFPNFREAVHDLAAMALRDRSMGTNNFLDDFIDLNLGSEYQYLGLFFRVNSVRWYKEIISFVSLVACEFDEFTIEDIVQHSPTQLKVMVNVAYHYEGSSLMGF